MKTIDVKWKDILAEFTSNHSLGKASNEEMRCRNLSINI
jgi:hypothetical protein